MFHNLIRLKQNGSTETAGCKFSMLWALLNALPDSGVQYFILPFGL